MSARRVCAQHFLHVAAGAQCMVSSTHATAYTYPEGSAKASVWLADVSHCMRWGFKGPHAAQWLAEQNITVPAAANSWCALEDGWGLIARAGNSEFFLETDLATAALAHLDGATHVPGVYPVLREDSAFVLSGPSAEAALLQICNIDFSSLDLRSSPLIMTLMAGVAVLVVPQMTGAMRRYRVWCDPSFGAYLWTALAQIVQDSAGSIIGAAQMPGGPRLSNDT
jgi:sarcosine oxidase subunit gamma